MFKKIALIIIFLFSVLGIIFQFSEIISITKNFPDYEKVYQISQDSDHLQFRSKANFIIWKVGQIILLSFTILLAYYNLKRDKGIIKYALYIIVTLYLFWIVRYYILWYLSGFDHYSGFDPYIF